MKYVVGVLLLLAAAWALWSRDDADDRPPPDMPADDDGAEDDPPPAAAPTPPDRGPPPEPTPEPTPEPAPEPTPAPPPEPPPKPVVPAPPVAPADEAPDPKRLEKRYEYYDGKRRRRVWLNPRLVVDFTKRTDKAGKPLPPRPGAALVRVDERTRIWRLRPGESSLDIAQQLNEAGTEGYAPMLQQGESADSGMRVPSGGIMVKFQPSWTPERVRSWSESRNLKDTKSMGFMNWYQFSGPAGIPSIELANEIHRTGEVLVSTPIFLEQYSLR